LASDMCAAGSMWQRTATAIWSAFPALAAALPLQGIAVEARGSA
jgi:hypothetical protein